jgi:type IV pilus assembly protein PilV
MIEVLVTMIIIAFGLLGIAGLQVRLQTSEMEAYQRSQALLLLDDMANRIAVNRNNAAQYVMGSDHPVGTGTANCASLTSPVPAGVASGGGTTTVDRDLQQWCSALQGAAETAAGSSVGGMVGGRGCVEAVGSDYLVTVVWQGLTPISAPPASVACGINLYNGAGSSACTQDRCRRAVTTLVRIGSLL